jgi:hypothetical protein
MAGQPCQPAGNKTCIVDDCGLSLDELKPFYHRARICAEHARELAVPLSGAPHRLCQQCGRLEPVSAFEAERRSCMISLEKHSKGLRRRRTASQVGDPFGCWVLYIPCLAPSSDL